MLKRISLITVATITFSASLVCSSEIKLGGGGASIATVFEPVKAAFEKTPGHNLIILQSTPVDGLKDLWEGKLEAAVTAVDLNGMIASVARSGVTVDKTALKVADVGTNKTVVLVHPSNKTTALSKEQLKGLFTGRTTNWKDVGGNDEPVLVVWGKNSPGQNALFSKIILDGEKVTSENLEASDYSAIKDSVASNQGAIGIDPLGMVDGTVKCIKPTPETNSTILLITRGEPSPQVRQLLDFIKTEGKKHLIE